MFCSKTCLVGKHACGIRELPHAQETSQGKGESSVQAKGVVLAFMRSGVNGKETDEESSRQSHLWEFVAGRLKVNSTLLEPSKDGFIKDLL